MSGINPKGLHLLLTYRCDSECDHCFVWGGPRAKGTMSLALIEEILNQGSEVDSVESIYFEGGEPFLYYPILLEGVRQARSRGFDVGIVSNAYWATSEADARMWLKPLADLGVSDLSISADELHGPDADASHASIASKAGEELGIPTAVLRVRTIESYCAGKRPDDDASDIYFRGRAAVNLAPKVEGKNWECYTSCPEEPPNMGRVHIDPEGKVQFCQGIAIGDMLKERLVSLFARFSPEDDSVVGPLIRGGPVSLADEHSIQVEAKYVDACHMCYDVRCKLRASGRLTESLVPDQAYGI
ncbi:MAG: radical SAM protein [Thermoplasmata archaeon]|nr:radical SAM protein [Thermoplasmata archaeon]